MSPERRRVLTPATGGGRVRIGAVVLLTLGAIAGGPGRATAQPHQAHGPGIVSGAQPAPSPARRQLWTCGMHPQVIRDEPGLCPICHMKLTPLETDGATVTGPLRIDPVIVQNMGIRVAEARTGTIARTVRAAGYLTEAEPNVHDVNLRVSGWIETLHADTAGMHVVEGEPLFELYSPELQVAVEELIASRKGDGGEAVVAQAARRKLERFGLRAADVDRLARLDRAPRTVTFTSPVSGHVTEKLVVAGAAVKAGDRVLRIVDHSTLWLDAQVHPEDLAAVEMAGAVQAVVDGVPGSPIEGRVAFIHPHLDPATRTATVRAHIPNPTFALRPGMYATVTIASVAVADALVVPREAVIDTGTRRLLFVALDGGRFEPREVTTGAAGDDGLVQIVDGLGVGERVVTSGQFLLDAESRMREAIQKHLSDRLLSEQP
jgi:multidrug efflux pump subunit AcrA (membrane-fusion protein)